MLLSMMGLPGVPGLCEISIAGAEESAGSLVLGGSSEHEDTRSTANKTDKIMRMLSPAGLRPG
jgi:hypothetical protein